LLSGSNDYDGILSPFDAVSQGTSVVRGNFRGFNPISKIAFIEPCEISKRKDIEVGYDILILCTGMKYTPPIKVANANVTMSDRKDQISKYYESLKDAKSIVVAGGGLVGVEMIAEIVCRLPGKN